VYDGLGKGEGHELVFKFRIYRDGSKIEVIIDGIEVLTQVSPVSFTLGYFESRKGGPEDATWTVRHTKAA
jgi:hypothetical protein